MKHVKNAVGKPYNGFFIRRCIVFGLLMAVMLFGADALCSLVMSPMAKAGFLPVWYYGFVPLFAVMMFVGLWRSHRRRWSVSYLYDFCTKARQNGLNTCPRCGCAIVERSRSRSRSVKVGERVTTTHYGDGSTSTRREDITENHSFQEIYYVCSNSSCALEVRSDYGQSHFPWKKKELRALILRDTAGFSKNRSSAQDLFLSRLLVPAVALVVVAVSAFSVYRYIDGENGVWVSTKANTQATRSEQEYTDFLLGLDGTYSCWSVEYTQSKTDFVSNLLGKELKSWFVACNKEGDRVAYTYCFDGDSLGTGLPDGEYTLTSLDGAAVLLDDNNRAIYKADSEYYTAYADKLRALTYDLLLGQVVEQLTGGEHALVVSGSFHTEFLRKDGSILYHHAYADGFKGEEFRAIINDADALVRGQYIFTHSDESYFADLEGYNYTDNVPQNDALTQFLGVTNPDDGSYALRERDTEDRITYISVDYFPNAYEFEFYDAGDARFEEDVIYRLDTKAQTLVKVTLDEAYNEVETPMPLSQYRAEYDYLLSVEPMTYIHAVFDPDKAEKEDVLFGAATLYKIKDENGEVMIEVIFNFGQFKSLKHYISDTQFVEITL